jgi:hypothetical protein
LTDNNTKPLLSKITKLIAKHAQDENDLIAIHNLICNYFNIANPIEKKAIVRYLNTQSTKSPRKLIAIDFDGVLYSVEKDDKETDLTILKNPPVSGAIKWLTAMVNDNRFFVTIYSRRAGILGFEEALHKWLLDNKMDKDLINKLTISITKPMAFLVIDTQCWKFNGKFPRPDDLLTFKTWYEQSG